MEKFNEHLKKLRKEKNLTQTQISELIDVKQGTYSRWESGKLEPSLENIIKLTKILDTTADELLGIDKSVSSNWIHGIKTTITKILDIPKDSQLQKRIEEELNFEWNKYIKKYPDLPIYSKIDWIPYQELELKNYNEIIENKDKRDILKKSILCAYLGDRKSVV